MSNFIFKIFNACSFSYLGFKREKTVGNCEEAREKLPIYDSTARYDKSNVTNYLKINSLVFRCDQNPARYHKKFFHHDNTDVFIKGVRHNDSIARTQVA